MTSVTGEIMEERSLRVCGILLAVTCVLAAPAPADVFGDAEWLRDPVFEGVEVVNLYRKEKAPKIEPSGPKNVHTYFRKEISLRDNPASAQLTITGDDYYYLYVNGLRVVQGPEAGYPVAHPYYVLDATPFFRRGTNSLAAHVYYQGLQNRVWDSGDNRSGFILALDVTYPDGGTERFVTDGTWKCLQATAYPTGRTWGYQTQFAEDIDMREIPKGWRDIGFDDSAWGTPLLGRQDHTFVKQITPPLEVRKVSPAKVVKKAEGHYFYDFGTEITGHTRVKVTGPAGHTMEVRHGEELSAPDEVRYEMRANCVYQEYPVLSGGEEVVEFFDYKGFRYMELLHAPGEPEVWVDVRHHPFDFDAARFACSDTGLVDIWTICRNGVVYGTQGGFLDCPTREKGPYLGDALITSKSHLYLTADWTMSRKALWDFHQSQRICPGIMGVAPGSFMQEIAEYSLQFPILLSNYYWYTGDLEFTRDLVERALPPLYDYFARFETEDGLISGMTEKWVLVDWPANLRDDYDYDYAKERENAVLNTFYYASLMTAADLVRATGGDPAPYETRAARVKAAFQKRMADPSTGLFVDAPGSTHSSLHANALPLRYGLAAPEQVPLILELIRQKRLSCGVYIAPFVIEACYEAGDPDLGYALLTSRDERSWHTMLAAGATACMEAWGPDQKRNSSWCHPWSSSPVYLIPERVLGLSPAAPGWSKVRFAPRVPAGLQNLELSVPTPQGTILIQYTNPQKFVLHVPRGVEVENMAEPPATVEIVDADGAPLSAREAGVLNEAQWHARVGGGLGVWVSVADQMLRVVQAGRVLWQAPCSTAAKGIGQIEDSMQTPVGWHTVAKRLGENAPWGQIFRGGADTGRAWRRGESTREDLVLTRVLVLQGEEEGLNKGRNERGEVVDSLQRRIYVHGTNDEDRVGTPSSHGCVRLRNDDVIAVFERISEGTPCLITQG